MRVIIKAIKIVIAAAAVFLTVSIPVYWFNLDTKAVKILEKPMMKHYDNMPRDNRL